MAQIRPVTSETLEAAIRKLLPSQNGFGEDLQAQNVIVPIIDLTSQAEGSDIAPNLQQCWDFSTTYASIVGAGTTALTSTPGFYKVALTTTLNFNNAGTIGLFVQINDGSTTKPVWAYGEGLGSVSEFFSIESAEFIVFLRAGDSIELVTTADTDTRIWYRQIADVYGNLNNPLGFQSQ